MNPHTILMWSLGLAVLALALWGGAYVWRFWRIQKAGARLEDVVKDYAKLTQENMRFTLPIEVPETLNDTNGGSARLGVFSLDWMKSGWVQTLFPQEDRTLLDQAGISLDRGGALYVLARVGLVVVLSVLAAFFSQAQGVKVLLAIFFAAGIGLMLPKWVVKSMATKRRKRVEEELPLFVDMLRLLQGVGLSIDQSLHILANEFSRVLKVISAELVLANRLYATGRSREQSFQRLIALSGDEDMVAIVNLLVQVDKHGGAVQEPLNQFALRLRERRQAAFKEKIGTITVKMTGVMVLTLLPALIVITAGPGFTAVMRSLSGMK